MIPIHDYDNICYESDDDRLLEFWGEEREAKSSDLGAGHVLKADDDDINDNVDDGDTDDHDVKCGNDDDK